MYTKPTDNKHSKTIWNHINEWEEWIKRGEKQKKGKKTFKI